MGRWIYKTDEAGRPRRFLSHREAAWWAMLNVAKVAGPVALFGFLRVLFELGVAAGWTTFLYLASRLLLLGLLACGVLYLYVALSGGVMARSGRGRL